MRITLSHPCNTLPSSYFHFYSYPSLLYYMFTLAKKFTLSGELSARCVLLSECSNVEPIAQPQSSVDLLAERIVNW